MARPSQVSRRPSSRHGTNQVFWQIPPHSREARSSPFQRASRDPKAVNDVRSRASARETGAGICRSYGADFWSVCQRPKEYSPRVTYSGPAVLFDARNVQEVEKLCVRLLRMQQ